jgi:type II secretory pathway pseudopilin PulG
MRRPGAEPDIPHRQAGIDASRTVFRLETAERWDRSDKRSRAHGRCAASLSILGASQDILDFATDRRPVRHALRMLTGFLEGRNSRARRGNMNVNGLSNPAFRSRGITLVEILLVISVLVILLSFAMPTAGSATARAELKGTLENVQYSIDAARNVARLTESGVSMNIQTSATDQVQTITFSRPPESRTANSAGPDLQDYRLPEGIRLETDHTQYVFDSRGLVEKPGHILLVSVVDESLTSTIEIN